MKVDTTEVLTVKHGKKRVHKHRTVLIGRHGYALAAGHKKTVEVTINSLGRRLLAAAKKHRLKATIVATVRGGKQASRHETIYTVSKQKHK